MISRATNTARASLCGRRSPKDFDLYFTVIPSPKATARRTSKRLISRFDLDNPPLAAAKKARMRRATWTATCTLILREFETRTQARLDRARGGSRGQARDHLRGPVCRRGRLYRHMDKPDEWIEMSDQTTWREVWPGSCGYDARRTMSSRDLGRAYDAPATRSTPQDERADGGLGSGQHLAVRGRNARRAMGRDAPGLEAGRRVGLASARRATPRALPTT